MLFTTPENINGTQLKAELIAAGITVGRIYIDENGKLNIDIKEADKAKTQKILAVHDGLTISVPLTKSELLAKLGITEDEAKLLLS